MATELTMPKNDMDMEEGTIVKWLKNVGDKVEKGEMFMEIETDKTSMEIESPAAGVLLAQFYQGGDVVPVNTVMGYVGEAGEAVPEQGAKAAAEEAPKEEKKEAPAAEKALKKITEMGFGDVPVCMAKNQYSLSDDPKLLGRPENFNVNIREVYVSAGAGFVVAITGAIMTMPGLPKKPAAEGIDVTTDGVITGLF